MYAPKKPELLKFAFFPNYDNAIKFLAEKLTKDENWDSSDSRTKQYSILKNYLEYIFRKLREEDKIKFTGDNKHACFNTGLVTSNLEDIIAFFEGYKKPRVGFQTPYCFKAFLKRSDRQLLKHFSSNLPDIANFFEKPELLIFNPKCELIPDIEHIIRGLCKT